jgi:hypothetical protein
MRKAISVFLTTLVIFASACTTNPLVGKWIKTSSELCTLAQPNELEFFDDGTYVGALPNWKGGNYRVVDSRRLKLDTTTGTGVYEFKRSGDSLAFKNDSGCEFRYRRSQQ